MVHAIRMLCGAIILCNPVLAVHAVAETITATCYGPSGKRLEYIQGKKEESDDGYSNSNPTFFYTSKDPDVLIESWQAALPFPDMIDRERVDEIVPPSVTKSVVIVRSEAVIHAISVEGKATYTTTLYLNKGVGIFTRIRLGAGGVLSGPMGAIYTANCNFQIV